MQIALVHGPSIIDVVRHLAMIKGYNHRLRGASQCACRIVGLRAFTKLLLVTVSSSSVSGTLCITPFAVPSRGATDTPIS